MGRFEPSADPRDAVERGFYVPRPGRSLAEQLAARFELKPSASHLLVGGVGSGKTTQLLVARDRLAATEDVVALYVDASFYTDPDSISSMDLLAIVGLELSRKLDDHEKTPELKRHRDAFTEYLRTNGEGWDDDPSEYFVRALRELTETTPPDSHIVTLIDSLDRISYLPRFAKLIDVGIQELRSLGIGVILVGPLTSLYGLRRVAVERFDRQWHLPSVDVQDDAEGRSFLMRVLRARDPDPLLTDGAAERLAMFSGGVLRDLIALTQAAGEEAYVDGADRVEAHHVDTVADVFGRKLLVALDSEQLTVLQRVRTHGTFVETSEKDLALLATRRVLEYASGRPRFTVHPTIEPLLAELAA